MLAKQLSQLEKMDAEILEVVCFLEEDVKKEIEQAGLLSLEAESAHQIISISTASSKASQPGNALRDQDQKPGKANVSPRQVTTKRRRMSSRKLLKVANLFLQQTQLVWDETYGVN